MADPKGEGIAMLAAVTNQSEQQMRRDPQALAAGLASLARIALRLIRDYASDDQAVREAAYRRWAELDAMLLRPDAQAPRRSPGLSERDRERLRSALTDVVEALRHVEREVSASRPNDTRESGDKR